MSGNAMILNQFGKRVRELRSAKGHSQEAFAVLCNQDRTYIGSIERGERNVSLKNIEIIASGLELTISELMMGVGVL